MKNNKLNLGKAEKEVIRKAKSAELEAIQAPKRKEGLVKVEAKLKQIAKLQEEIGLICEDTGIIVHHPIDTYPRVLYIPRTSTHETLEEEGFYPDYGLPEAAGWVTSSVRCP